MSFSIRCMQLNIKSQVILFHWLEDQHIILLLPELIHILINLISSPQFLRNHCVECYTKQITYHSLSLHSNGIEQPQNIVHGRQAMMALTSSLKFNHASEPRPSGSVIFLYFLGLCGTSFTSSLKLPDIMDFDELLLKFDGLGPW